MRFTIILILASLQVLAQDQVASDKLDLLGTESYEMWLKSSEDSNLEEAQEYFIQAFTQLPASQQFEYALDKARLFKKDTAKVEYVVKWYQLVLNKFESREIKKNERRNAPDEAKRKSKLLLEFTKVYSRQYGECQKALDILKKYNTDFWFSYMKHNRDRKPYEWTWSLLIKEDQFLNLKCN